jgi:hypothetical protein
VVGVLGVGEDAVRRNLKGARQFLDLYGRLADGHAAPLGRPVLLRRHERRSLHG